MGALTDIPAGIYPGRVSGSESGSCEACINVARIPGNCLAVDYEAIGSDGIQHIEHTILADDAVYVASNEASGVQVFHRTPDGVFDGHRMALTVCG